MINTINHNINIDLANKINMNQSINIKKNDTNSHKFVINIFNSSVAYDLTGTTSRIYFEKSDATKVFLDCTLDNALTGKLSCLLTTQALSYAGLVASEITIYGTAGEILTSVTFNFTVSEVIRDDAAIQSTSEFTALTNALTTIDRVDLEVTNARKGEVNLGTKIGKIDTSLADNVTQLALKAPQSALDTTNTEITNARGGEINLDTRLDKVDTSLANKVIKGELFINVKDYGAVGDGTTDDTQAFIDANNTLINGGIIYIPVGKFVLKSQLTLSKGVNLVGVKSKDDEKQGSAIYITNSTTQAIVLNSRCSVEGITFYYPTQLNTGAGSAIVFPSLFLSNVGGASDIDILDCAFINVYQIADFTNSHGGITVQRCTGFVLNLGFDVDNCTDIDRFKDIHINPIFWKDAFSPTDFSQITRANAILFKLKRADWIIIENCFCWGYNKGIYITDGVSGSIASGDIKNCGFDMTEKGIYCDTASAWGINIEGCSFSAQDPINIAEIHNAIEFTAIGYGISIKNNKFWGCTGGTIKLISISGTPKGVIIEGNQIMSWGSKSISTDLQYGILVQNVEGLIVGNNILKGNSYAYARGIRLISCRNQVITGNVIQDIANDGIMVLDAGGLPISDYYIVKHNIIKTTGNAISDTATGINKLVTENLA